MGKLTLLGLYIVPFLVVLWLWLTRDRSANLRIAALLLLPILYYAYWKAIEHREGWPADERLPNQFELIGSSIIEPDSTRSFSGRIFIWAKVKGRTEPRSYVLPYTRKLHKMLFEAEQRIRDGVRQRGVILGREQRGKSISIGRKRHLMFENSLTGVLPPKV